MGRKDVDEICERYLSRREERDKVAEAVERCIKKGYDYEKLKDKVYAAVSDSQKANKVVDKVVAIYPQLRKRNRFEESKDSGRGDEKRARIDRDKEKDRERERERDREKEREKERENEREKARERERKRDRDEKEKERENREKEREKEREREAERDQQFILDKEKLKQVAKEVLERKKKEEEELKNAVVTEEQLRAKELMYRAQQEIEERKRQLAALAGGALGIPPPAPTQQASSTKVVLRPQEAAMFVSVSMEKQNRMDEIKARLARSSNVLGNLTALQQQKQGLPVQPEMVEEREEVVERKAVKEEKEEEIKEFMDPRLKLKTATRQRRTFNFHEKGEFEKLANKQRAVAKLEKLQAEISEKAKTTGISSAVKLAMVTPAGRSIDDVPDIEWWDQIVLEKDSYDEIPHEEDSDRFAGAVSELVEHPTQMRPPTEPLSPQYLKVFLTKKEKKKIRRQNRKEAQKEQTEKIRLGLEKPPEPKVKLSNLMRVLGSDAVQDPTKMEAHVRKQMADRLKRHEADNAARKLTDAQRAEKKAKKISEDTSLAVNVAVYRIKSLAHPAKKFKVETNAKQLQMSGIILMHKDINVVVVEGGPKQQKFYKNLMLSRMKWGDEVIGQKKEADKEQEGERNECKLIWEGTVKRRAFNDMRCVTATIVKQAREVLERHNVAHYWDLSYSTTVLLEGETEGST